MTDTYNLIAYDGTGARCVVGERAIPRYESHDISELVTAAASAVGAPVAMLGVHDDDLLCVEVLDDSGLTLIDAELPDGWAERAPWRQPGWYAATVERIDAALGEAGFRRTGEAVQTKHWSISALMRVPTDGGDVWFKQVPAMFAHEGRLVAWLAELVPELMAAPLAVGDDWWIAHDLGAEQPVPAGQELGAVDVLVTLQGAASERADELLLLGCPDRRLPVLLAEVAALADRGDALSDEQRDRLRASLPALAAVVDRLGVAGLPDTVVHGDFHSGNTRFTRAGWSIYDWTDGCLAHPLTDLAPSGFAQGEAVAMADGRLARTTTAWQARCPALTEQVAALGLVVGAAHQLVTYYRIADGVEANSVQTWAGEGGRWADQLILMLAAS